MVASHKYVKREGSAGNYKYFYKEHKKSPEGTEGLFDRKKGTLTDPITKAKYSVDPVLIDSLAELTRS